MDKSASIILFILAGFAVLSLIIGLNREAIFVFLFRYLGTHKKEEYSFLPENVEEITGLMYGSDKENYLSIFYPTGTIGNCPAIISIHGGGYIMCDTGVYRDYCIELAQRGFAVVNIGYRLAPENHFPAQIEDVNTSVAYVTDHANELHVDKNNLFFVGDSSGAQLLSQYAAILTNHEFAECFRLSVPQITVRAIALNCGMYIASENSKIPFYNTIQDIVYGKGNYSIIAKKVAIENGMNKAFPPCFIMTATGDVVREQAAPMKELLDAYGVENELHVYGDEKNRPGHCFHLYGDNELSGACNDDECAFFRRHIRTS